jgi:hypothetical protein
MAKGLYMYTAIDQYKLPSCTILLYMVSDYLRS